MIDESYVKTSVYYNARLRNKRKTTKTTVM